MWEQPADFTLIDLVWRLLPAVLMLTGCYVGWKAGENVLALLVGAMFGWMVARILTLQARAYVRSRDSGERGPSAH